MKNMFARITLLLCVLIICAAMGVQLDAETKDKDELPIPKASGYTLSMDNYNLDISLTDATSSIEAVPVIIILKNQPAGEIVEGIQERFLPHVKAKNAEVRKILSKYAGNRKFDSKAQVINQAALEANAVTAADKAAIKAINKDVDIILDSMRKEISNSLKKAVANDQSEISSYITSLGGKVNYEYSIKNAVSAIIPGNLLITISQHPLVSRISEDGLREENMNVSGPSMFVNSFWTPGFDGGIWDAAIMDTGVDTSHPALDDDTEGTRTWYSHTFHDTAEHWTEYGDDVNSTDDLQGHGTHVAGTILSSSATYRGIAFGGDVGINLKAGFRKTNGGGACYDSDAHAALDWSWQQGEEPEAVNFSFGGSTTVDDDSHAQYFDSFIEAKSTTCAISAGNDGSAATTINSPGISYNAITVASIYDLGTTSRTDDIISGFSSRGPTIGGRRKPDIAAPGEDIMSANRNWETGDDFISKSGTSMASPHIAGSAILLCDVGVTDPREIKALLINTADDLGTAGWDSAFGWGYVNLAEAYLHRGDSDLYNINEKNLTGSYKLFKTTGMVSGDKATMVWYRHALYNNAAVPATVYSLNDLDLRLYDETNNYEIASDTTTVDNVQQVVSDRSATGVIRAYAYTPNFYHGYDYETFALAYPANTILANDPTVTPTANSYTPPLYAKFNVSVRVQNTGDLAAHNVSVTITLPSGVTLSEGSLTQNLGKINAGGSAYATYTLDTTSGGAKTITMATSSISYGVSFSGSGSFTVTPSAQDTVAPYTTMGIGQPSYQTGGTNLTTNGGFESSLTGWTTSGTAVIETGSAHSGSKNLRLGSGAGSAYQQVSISSGASNAVMTFWYKSSASMFADVGVRITDSSGTTLIYPFSTTYSQSNWDKVTLDISRFRGQTIRTYFYSSTLFSLNSTLYVDDVTIKEGEQIWVNDTSQLWLSADDDNSGVDYTQYHINSDSFATYTSSFDLTGRPEGSNYVYYRSVDNGAITEPANIAYIGLDTEAPRSILSVGSPRSIVGGTEKVTNSGFESNLTGWIASGIVSAVSSPVHNGARSARIGVTGEGSLYQDVYINSGTDKAFLRFFIKSTEGTGSSYIKMSIVDPASGLSCYSAGFNYTSDWNEWIWDVSRFKGSLVRIRFDVIVSSGGAATAYIDDVNVLEGASLYVGPYTGLTIYSAERSGESLYESKIDSGVFTAGQTFTIPTNGVHNVRYKALDNVGNQESEVLTQIITDAQGPTGTITINNDAAYTTSRTVTLSLTWTDNSSPTAQMRIRPDNGVWGGWQPFQSSIPYMFVTNVEETKTFSVEFKDEFGNVSSTYSDSIEYKAPIVSSITPNKGFNTGSVSITNLAGRYFEPGATVKLTKKGESDIVATSVSVVNSTKITCSFNLAGKTTGLWNVVVTNPDGLYGSLTSGFTIAGIYTLTGTVNLSNYIASPAGLPITVEFLNPGTQVVVRTENVLLDSTGKFTIPNVEQKIYDIRIKASHWLAKTIYGVNVSGN